MDSKINRQNLEHQQTINQQNHEYDLQLQSRQFEHEDKQKAKEIGLLGILFGAGEHSSRNIAALISLILIVGASIVSCYVYYTNKDTELIANMWNKILPIIALSLGYVFGKRFK